MEAILANIQAFTGDSKASAKKPSVISKVKHNESVKSALYCLCFSKDRPYQLHQLLHSLNFVHDISIDIEIVAIYKTSSNQSRYEKVAAIHPSVKFIAEEQDGFDETLRRAISSSKGTHIMFLVDDLVFLDRLPVSDILKVLDTDDGILGVQLKLHPGILFSHAAGKACFPPALLCANPNSFLKHNAFLKAEEYSLEILNAYIDLPSIPMYDIVKYRQRNYISAHIGDVFLTEAGTLPPKDENAQ
eukprot:gene44195-54037_t